MTNKGSKLKMKIMPHKEDKTAAVFIEGFRNENEAKSFCMSTCKLEGFTFINFLGQNNEQPKEN